MNTTLEDKMQALLQDYTAQDIADKIYLKTGRCVPLSTLYAYANGKNKEIRIIAVREAFDDVCRELLGA